MNSEAKSKVDIAHQTRVNANDWNYEGAIAEIEGIIGQLESGELPLETVFAQFEVAVAQLKHCEQFLNQGQERLDLLIETLTDDEA